MYPYNDHTCGQIKFPRRKAIRGNNRVEDLNRHQSRFIQRT